MRAAVASPACAAWPRPYRLFVRPRVCRQCTAAPLARSIQISSAPATEFPRPAASDVFGSTDSARDDADASFEVLGSPYSLLSVRLSASQKLYTRRGTLVSVAGKLENARSTLSILSPIRRSLLGMPFLYQRITSTTPLTLLIGTRAASTTLFTLRLDGTTDWIVAQRNALLAWTGHTLSVTPQRQSYDGNGLGLGIAHWGSSFLTGRGLAALAAPGYIYPVTLAAGEELAVHPSHVVAYALSRHAPQPFRLRETGATSAAAKAAKAAGRAASATASRLHLQTPAVPAVPDSLVGFWRALRDTATYKFATRVLFNTRTLLRQTIWGDRLLVRIHGPTTLLLSSRGVRVSEVMSRDQVNEIADTQAGVLPAALEETRPEKMKAADAKPADTKPLDTKASDTKTSDTKDSTVAVHIATVKKDGKVEFTDAKDLKEFVQ